MKKACLAVVVFLLILGAVPAGALGDAQVGAQGTNSQGLTLDYHLSFTEDDHPTVEVHVSGADGSTTTLTFTTGSYLGALREPVSRVFPVDGVVTPDGQTLTWTYQGNDLRVSNGSASEFTLTYRPDMSRLGREEGPGWQAFAMFRRQTVFFVAEDVFPMPTEEPARITVRFTLSGRTKVFCNLEEEEPGLFVCRPDLFGNLRYDFPKAYFTGGEPFFTVSHETEQGDKYIYVWFAGDTANQMWRPSWGTTPWEEAERYMGLHERFAAYFREMIGPLPARTVVFTDHKHPPDVDLRVNIDYYHWMQVWPRDSEGQLAHHVLHAYDFWPSQAKMWFSPDFSQPSGYLREGLNTYYEQVIPARVLGQDRQPGLLYVFLALDQRGRRFGVQDNEMHKIYNASTLKVYLLDQYVARVTGGEKNLDDFFRALWDLVKDNTEPHTLSAQEISAAFSEVVGQENSAYLTDLVRQSAFEREDFASLQPLFEDYVNWLADGYLWGKPALYCALLDVALAKGEQWPHYAMFTHNFGVYRQGGLQPVHDYLTGLGREDFTEGDIIAALGSATGRDHSGFFDFWNDFGVSISPADFAPLFSWDPNAATESDLMEAWMPVGTLWTEHYLSGVQQKAEIVLDRPAPGTTLGLQVSLRSLGNPLPEAEAKSVAGGPGVSFVSCYQDQGRGVNYTRALFRITTDDPERRVFSFDLTLPPPEAYPSFGVLQLGPLGLKKWLGEILSPGSVDPVAFSVGLEEGELTLPDTELEGESFRVSFEDGSTAEAGPGETVILEERSGVVEVQLIDSYGFLRAVSLAVPESTSGSEPSNQAPATPPPLALSPDAWRHR